MFCKKVNKYDLLTLGKLFLMLLKNRLIFTWIVIKVYMQVNLCLNDLANETLFRIAELY